MTESDKKRLTEWLGERPLYYCGVSMTWVGGKGGCIDGRDRGSCDTCEYVKRRIIPNRTFADPADFFACFNRLVEKGEWDEFDTFITDKFFNQNDTNYLDFILWLLSSTESGEFRLCQFVAEWLTAQEEKGEGG